MRERPGLHRKCVRVAARLRRPSKMKTTWTLAWMRESMQEMACSSESRATMPPAHMDMSAGITMSPVKA